MTTPATPYGTPLRPSPAPLVRFTAACPACAHPHDWEQRNTTPMTPPVPQCPAGPDVEAA